MKSLMLLLNFLNEYFTQICSGYAIAFVLIDLTSVIFEQQYTSGHLLHTQEKNYKKLHIVSIQMYQVYFTLVTKISA